MTIGMVSKLTVLEYVFAKIARGQSSKDPRPKALDPKHSVLTCKQSRRAEAAPTVVKPAPAPPNGTPVETADVEAATRVAAVDGPREENQFAFPLFGDEFGVFEEEIQHIGVQNFLDLERLILS